METKKIEDTEERRGKTCHTNNTRENCDKMDAYLKNTLEFLLSNTRYLFLLNVKGWMPLRNSPLQRL